MKKSLFGLAALGLVGTVAAQVTVYGKADVGYVNTASVGSIVSGGYEGSRIGVKGTTDLGGGMTGVFKVEGGMSTADGTFAGFGREANVGFSGAFGALTAGLQWSPYDNAIAAMDAMEYNGFSPVTVLSGFDLGNTGNGNVKSSVQWASPIAAGFQATLMAAPNAGDLNKRNYNGMGLNFAQGPVALSLATQSYEASTTSTVKSLALGGSINLEKAVVFLGMTTTNDGSAKAATGQTFGIKIPVGENYVSLAWARGTQATETVGWGVQYIYNWNKSAVIYTGYKVVRDPAATINTAGVGVRYDF
jgi:hypothetical protein